MVGPKNGRMGPSFLVLSGDGINCERETASAFEMAGAKAKVIHINDLLKAPTLLREFQGLAIPGGFSFGDELGSGQILSLKIKYGLEQEFFHFLEEKKPVIGICNGFQVLTKLGLLPNFREERKVALARNIQGQFIDRWVSLKRVEKNVCVWTKGMEEFCLPIRHGEGRLTLRPGREEVIYQSLKGAGQIALEYTEEVNGSYRSIAGLCDPTGLVLGLMPHPEAAVSGYTYPGRQHLAPGRSFFTNIVEYLNKA